MNNENNMFNQNSNIQNLNGGANASLANNTVLNNSTSEPFNNVNDNTNINTNTSVINQNVTIPNFVNYDNDSSIAESNNQTMMQQNQENVQSTNTQVLYDTTNQINDKPIEKKQKKSPIKINQDLKTALVLMAILLVIIWLVPELLDLFY